MSTYSQLCEMAVESKTNILVMPCACKDVNDGEPHWALIRQYSLEHHMTFCLPTPEQTRELFRKEYTNVI